MTKNLHILLLSSWYPSRISPTNGNFIQNHAETISTKHKVTVVFSIGDKNLNQPFEIISEVKNNVSTIIIYFKKHSNKLINGFRKYSALKKGISLVDNFDIIHGNVIKPIGIFAFIFSIIYKKPYILTEHWSGYLPDSNISQNYFTYFLYKLIVKKAEFILPVSTELKNAMINYGFNGNYKVIGNVIDTKLFYPNENKSGRFTIVHVSNFVEESKNITGILNVIKKLSEKRTDFIFKIIGDGNLKEVQKKIIKLQIPSENIITEGTKTSLEISKIFQTANLYISFSNYETFGIAVVEALACGLPIISTNKGVISEFEYSNFIHIIKPKDEIALLKKINQIINSNKLFNSNEISYFIDNHFSIKSISNKYSQLYTEVNLKKQTKKSI